MNEVVPVDQARADAELLDDDGFAGMQIQHPFFTTKELRSSLLATTVEIAKANAGKAAVTTKAVKEASAISAYALALCLTDETAHGLLKAASDDLNVEDLYKRAVREFELAAVSEAAANGM